MSQDHGQDKIRGEQPTGKLQLPKTIEELKSLLDEAKKEGARIAAASIAEKMRQPISVLLGLKETHEHKVLPIEDILEMTFDSAEQLNKIANRYDPTKQQRKR